MPVRAATVALLAAMVASPALQAAEFDRLEVDKRGKRYFVDSQVVIAACPASVFQVLTDYDDNGLTRLSKVMVESRYLERDERGNGLVYTRAEGCVAFFCRELERVEEVTVEPVTYIQAIAIPERSDANFSEARWRLEPENETTRLTYTMEFEPDFWVPPLIGTAVLAYQLKKEARRAVAAVERLAADMGCSDAPAAVAETAPAS